MTADLGALAFVIVLLLAASAFFSGAETALTGASRARMHQLEREGSRSASRVNKLIAIQERVIGSMLLGNNLINILSGALMTEALAHTFKGGWGVAVATALTTFLVLVFAEVLPKTLAINRPDASARLLSWPILIATRAFGPVIFAIQWLIAAVLKLFGVALSPEAEPGAAQTEIRGAVEFHHAEGKVESSDRRMLGGVLDLADMDVSEIMVHRKNIVMLDAGQPAAEVVALALEASNTRIPLYKGDPDNIVGILHARDLARAVAAARGAVETLDVQAIAREPWFIPDSTAVTDQLNAFLKRKSHFALIVDEYGALQGLVTLEDILEEIVGEIEDEHDAAVSGLQKQADGSIVVDGAVAIRDLNRALDWNLPDDDWVTVAGLVIHEAQTIPDPGQTFIFHGHRFQVLSRQRNQLTQLKVSPRLEETVSTA